MGGKSKGFYKVALICFAFMILLSFNVNAESDRSYYISQYNINVNINSDGSANIEEQITYDFDGHFNGVTMDLDYSGASELKDLAVFIKKNDKLVAVSPEKTLQGPIVKLKLYESSDDEKKTFVYRYKLTDVVTKYSDVAEFNRKLIGTNWTVKLENININIVLPEGATKEEIRIFAHGPLTGSSKIIDGKNINLQVALVPQKTFVEARAVFPTKLVPNAKKIENKNALDEILKHEGILADEANLEREKVRAEEKKKETLKKAGDIGSILLIFPWLALIGWIYVKFDKELKSSFQGKYFRELPGDYTPAEMSVLMNFGKVESRDIMATLMDLVRKNQLEINPTSITTKGIFRTKEQEDYIISLKENPKQMELKQHEQFLIDWFINKIGNGKTLLLGDIKKYVKDKSNALQFKDDYDTWKIKVSMEAEKNNFFNNSLGKGKGIGILSAILYAGLGILGIMFLKSTWAILLIVLGVIILVYAVKIKKRSAYGNDQYKMWTAFKNFLKDFSNMKEAVVKSVVIWEHYLVYAISLGVAKEVIDQLPKVFNENEFDDPDSTLFRTMAYGNSYMMIGSLNHMFQDTMSTVDKAIVSAQSVAASQNSSGSGFGGGFSGGSSGGGGGSSGGGAF